jgi:hypothetical protein
MEPEPVTCAMQSRPNGSFRRSVFASDSAHNPASLFAAENIQKGKFLY